MKHTKIKITAEHCAQLRTLYKTHSLSEIGHILGRTRDAIRYRFVKCGIPRRPQGGANNVANPSPMYIPKDEILSLTAKELSDYYQIPIQRVHAYRSRMRKKLKEESEWK